MCERTSLLCWILRWCLWLPHCLKEGWFFLQLRFPFSIKRLAEFQPLPESWKLRALKTTRIVNEVMWPLITFVHLWHTRQVLKTSWYCKLNLVTGGSMTRTHWLCVTGKPEMRRLYYYNLNDHYSAFFAIIKCNPLSRHRFQNISHPDREKQRIRITTEWFHPALIVSVIEPASRQT